MSTTRTTTHRWLQLALGVALMLYGIAGFPSPDHSLPHAEAQVHCYLNCVERTQTTNPDGTVTATFTHPHTGETTTTTWAGIYGPVINIHTQNSDGSSSTYAYNPQTWEHSTTTTTSAGTSRTQTCGWNGCTHTTTTTTTSTANHQAANRESIEQSFLNNDGVNGRDGDAGVQAMRDWYEENVGRDYDTAETVDRDAVNYGQCVSWGLSGCSISDPAATQRVMFNEGVSRGVDPDNPSYENFQGDRATTNFENDIWFDRCPTSVCGSGYRPPGGHTPSTTTTTQTVSLGSPPPACNAPLTVLDEHAGGADDGCRPPQCDFGRGSDGWCLPPASADPPVVYVVGPARVDEDAGSARFRVVLSHAATQPVSVTAYTRGGTASSAQGDFTAVNRGLTIRAGSTLAWVHVAVLDDTLDEPDETFTLHISDPSSNAELSASTFAEATIVDNDDPAVPGEPHNLELVCTASNSGFTPDRQMGASY